MGHNLRPVKIRELPSPPVHLYLQPDGNGLIFCIGTLNALNWANGQILEANMTDEKDIGRHIANLPPRSAEAVPGDFNKDGLRDWVICAFGHDFGDLYLFQQTKDRNLKTGNKRHDGSRTGNSERF